jgi:two-component system chemotaxis response regulator CheB
MRRELPLDFKRPVQAVIIGASAGGVDALLQLLVGLPGDYPLPVIVVLHIADDRTSLLPEVFGHRLALPVREAADKETIMPGTVYFAPAGYHLLTEAGGSFSLSCDARVHFSRPSIDVLMESAADAFGAGLAGILLTGANEDGAAGLSQVGRAGGLTVVQDPAEAQSSTMPKAAIELKSPDYVLPLKDIKSLIARLTPGP